jgi:hypothetical protein
MMSSAKLRRMMMLLALLGLGSGQHAFGTDNGDDKSAGLNLRGVEKGLQSVGQGISKGARESGIENGLTKAGNGIKDAGEKLGKKLDKSGGKSQDDKK